MIILKSDLHPKKISSMKIASIRYLCNIPNEWKYQAEGTINLNRFIYINQ